MPRDTPKSIVDECRSYGAEVELVAGVITDAGKRVQQYIAANGGFDLSTLKEPYRVEGKRSWATSCSKTSAGCPTSSSIRPAAAPA